MTIEIVFSVAEFSPVEKLIRSRAARTDMALFLVAAGLWVLALIKTHRATSVCVH